MNDVSPGPASLLSFLEGTISLRHWERAEVPFSSPQIAFDIALHVTQLRLENRFIPLKGIHLSVNHSADRVREILGTMIRDGWIERTEHPNDRRMRLLRASDKLVSLMASYEEHARIKLTACQTCREPE